MQYAPLFDPVQRTSMEAAMPKYRKRVTWVPDIMQCTVELTSAQLATLKTFIDTTLQFVGQFDWKDFRDGTTATYCFMEIPTETGIANRPGTWSVPLKLLKVA